MENSALFNISYGLYLLTANENGFDNGSIINTLAQVTYSPDKISVTVNKSTKTHEMIFNTNKFNASILTEKCPFELIERFGFQSGNETDKFKGFDGCQRSENGIMYLTDFSNSYLSCEVIDKTDLGSHTLFIANINNSKVTSDEKSLTYDYYHKNIKPKKWENTSTSKTYYRCIVCGYIYEGEELPKDFICPWCKHGVEDFEKVVENE